MTACSDLHDSYVAMGRLGNPNVRPRRSRYRKRFDNVRNRALVVSTSFELISNRSAVICCGRVRTGGGGSSTNVCVSTNLQLCHGTGARGASHFCSVETDVTDTVSFCVGLSKNVGKTTGVVLQCRRESREALAQPARRSERA
jgi:hypothetical protein